MAKKVIKDVADTKEKTEQDTCFVIMPFGSFFDSYYNDIYKKAIEEVGLIPKRADDLYRSSTIVQDIWNYTKAAKVILADLTGKNPNVFYELGLAHALAKPAILITNTIEDVPFDLRALRVLTFDKNHPNWGNILQEKIKSSLKETLESPINSVLPTFIDTQDLEKRKITISEKDFIELKQDFELLKTQIRQTSRPKVINQIEPEEAEFRIRNYIKRGYSPAMIVRRLEPYGPPKEWILNKFNEIKGEENSLFNED